MVSEVYYHTKKMKDYPQLAKVSCFYFYDLNKKRGIGGSIFKHEKKKIRLEMKRLKNLVFKKFKKKKHFSCYYKI